MCFTLWELNSQVDEVQQQSHRPEDGDQLGVSRTSGTLTQGKVKSYIGVANTCVCVYVCVAVLLTRSPSSACCHWEEAAR